jgi:hypothetical protein
MRILAWITQLEKFGEMLEQCPFDHAERMNAHLAVAG